MLIAEYHTGDVKCSVGEGEQRKHLGCQARCVPLEQKATKHTQDKEKQENRVDINDLCQLFYDRNLGAAFCPLFNKLEGEHRPKD